MSTPPHPVAPQRFVLGSSGFEWQIAIKHLICATFHQLKEPVHTGKYPKLDDMPANEKEKYTRLLGGACALVQDSLDKSDLETMRHNKEWTEAYTNNDPIGMMKAAKNTLIQPRMSALRSAPFVRLVELTQQKVQDIHRTVALTIDEHNKFVYYNNDKEMDELQHSVLWECLASSLGPKYQNFVEMEDTRTTTESKNVVTLVKRAQAFAIRHGLDKKATEPQQPTQTEPPSAFRADTRTPRRDERERGDQKCDRCGTLGHRPSQCQEKHVWCDTCAAEGKTPRQCNTHSTKAHRGPRRQQGKDGKERRGGNQNRKEGERKTTFKTTEEAPNRQVNFLSTNDDSETDDWDEEPVAFATWITEDGPSPDFLHCERVQSTVLIAKDGNCFFSAIGTAVGMGMQEVRNLAASFIEQNAGQASHVPSLTWEQYICLELGKNLDECMRLVRGRAYGGGVEAAALEHVLNRDIAVYSKISNSETGERLGYKLLQAPSQNVGAPIWLLWTEGASEAGHHYDLLIAQGVTPEQTTPRDGPSQPRTYAAVAASPTPARPSVIPTASRPPTSSPTPTPVIPSARKTYASVAAAPPLTRATKSTPQSTTTVYPTPIQREPPPPPITVYNIPISAFNAADEERVSETANDNGEPSTHTGAQQQFYLDSGASEHLFDASVATVDNNPRTIAVAGISGIVQARTGSHTTFGRVLINPNAKGRNLVSLSNLRRTHKVTYDDQRDAFVARQRNQQLVFQSNRRLYTLATPALVLHASAANVRGIQAAIKLRNTLHHPSDD